MGFRIKLSKVFTREITNQEIFQNDLSAIVTRAIFVGREDDSESNRNVAYDAAKSDLESLFKKRQELFDEAIFIAGHSKDGKYKDDTADGWKNKKQKEQEQQKSITAQVLNIVRDESDLDVAAMQMVAADDLINEDIEETDDGYKSEGVSFSIKRLPHALAAATHAKPWKPLTAEGREDIAANVNASVQFVVNQDGSKAVTASFGRFANIGKQADKFAAMIDAELGKKINITGFKKDNMLKVAKAIAKRGTRDLADIQFEGKSAAQYFGEDKASELNMLFKKYRPNNQERLNEAKNHIKNEDMSDVGYKLFQTCRTCNGDNDTVNTTAQALAAEGVDAATAARAFADIPEAQRSDVYFQYKDGDAAKVGNFLARLDDGVFEKLYKGLGDDKLNDMVGFLYAAERKDNTKIAQLLDHNPNVVFNKIFSSHFPEGWNLSELLAQDRNIEILTPVLIKAKPETLVAICDPDKFNTQANTVLQLLDKDDAEGTCRAKFLNEIVEKKNAQNATEIFGVYVKNRDTTVENCGKLVQALYKENHDNASSLMTKLDAGAQAKSLAGLSSITNSDDAAKTGVELLIPKDLDENGANKFVAVLSQLHTDEKHELIDKIVDQLSSGQVQSLMKQSNAYSVKSFMGFLEEDKQNDALTKAVPVDIIGGEEATIEQKKYLDELKKKFTPEQKEVLEGVISNADAKLASKIGLFDACQECNAESNVSNVVTKLLKMTGAKVQAEAFGYIPVLQKIDVFTKMLKKLDLKSDNDKKTASEFLVNLSNKDLRYILGNVQAKNQHAFLNLISSQKGADDKLLGVMSAGAVEGDGVSNICACYLTPGRMVSQFGGDVDNANEQWGRLGNEGVVDGKKKQDNFLVKLASEKMVIAAGILAAEENLGVIKSSLVVVANQSSVDTAADLGNMAMLKDGFGSDDANNFSTLLSLLRNDKQNDLADGMVNKLTNETVHGIVMQLRDRNADGAIQTFFNYACYDNEGLIVDTFNKALPDSPDATDIAVLAASLSNEQRKVIQDKVINEHGQKDAINAQLKVFDQCKVCDKDPAAGSAAGVANKITELTGAKAQAAAYSFVPDNMRPNVLDKIGGAKSKNIVGNMLSQLSNKDLAVEFKEDANMHKALDYISSADNSDATLENIANHNDFKGGDASNPVQYYYSPKKMVDSLSDKVKISGANATDRSNNVCLLSSTFCLEMYNNNVAGASSRTGMFLTELANKYSDAANTFFTRYAEEMGKKSDGDKFLGQVLNTFSVTANANVAKRFFKEMDGKQQTNALNNMFTAKKVVDERVDAKTVFNNILGGLIPEAGGKPDKFLEMSKELNANVKTALFELLTDGKHDDQFKPVADSFISSDNKDDVQTLLKQAGDKANDVLTKMVPDGLKAENKKPEDEDEDVKAKWDDDCDRTEKLLGKLDKKERLTVEDLLSNDAKDNVGEKVKAKENHPAQEDESFKTKSYGATTSTTTTPSPSDK